MSVHTEQRSHLGPAGLWIGVFDSLSARLVAQTAQQIPGTHICGLWVSSYCVSASLRACPDASIVSSSEMIAVGRLIQCAAQGLPVILDCDCGYGDATVLGYVVDEVCRTTGISGICIEDKVFPKRNSFYVGGAQQLEDEDAFAEKIRTAAAVRDAVRSDLSIVARTEALVVGAGVKVALERLSRFVDAGADALMVQATGPLEELRAVAARWKQQSAVPLVAAPTLYPTQSAQQFWQDGFDIYIYANQLLRGAGQAMSRLLTALQDTAALPIAVDDDLWSLSDLNDLVGAAKVLRADAHVGRAASGAPGPDDPPSGEQHAQRVL